MADVDINDVIEVTAKGKFNTADDIINVYQAKITDPQGGTKAETLSWVGEYLVAIGTPLNPLFHPTYELVELIVENLTQNTFLGQIVVGTIGTNLSEALPPQVCALVMARTPTPAIDGRKYLGPFGEDTQSQGIWTAGTLTALQAFATVWEDVFVAVNLVTGVAVIVTKVPLMPPVEHTIEGTRVILTTRTQRRRTIGRGS